MEIPTTMRAMVLERPGELLRMGQVPVPRPAQRQVLIRVHACAVCRTDLHIVDQELPNPKLPLILGHEVPIRTKVHTWPLDQANEALDRLRRGQIEGAAVLQIL